MYNYSLDVSLTDDCNFACKYCIERGYFKPNYMTEETALAIIHKLEYMKFNDPNLNKIKIGFWGGEPTLNLPIIKLITDHFKNHPDFMFNIYTNGYNFDDSLADYIEEINNSVCNPNFKNIKFGVQISYDGNPIHDLCRVTRDGMNTGLAVRNVISKYVRRNLNLHLKSTITFPVFQFIYDSYMDIVKLNEELNLPIDSQLFYAPTIDYSLLSINKLTIDEQEHLIRVFKDNMQKIASYECKRYKQDKVKSILSWFDTKEYNRKLCSAGHNFHVVNYNGDMYTCHGCIYTETNKDHLFATIFDDDKEFLTKVTNWSDKFKNVIYEPEECKQCDTIICMRCNAVKYSISQKEQFIDKWTDFAIQPFLCKLYKSNTNIIRAMKMINANV